MAGEISRAVDGNVRGIWLYGSAALGDHRPGWSDIDVAVLANAPLTQRQAERLLTLRQELSERFPSDPYFPTFKGFAADAESYLGGKPTRAVYWGTSGQRIVDRCPEDAFAAEELAVCGRCVLGDGDRSAFRRPGRGEIVRAVRRHCEGIRRYAAKTSASLYSCGWLLDIARCVWTLRFGGVTGKTQAGYWALESGLFGDGTALKRALAIREAPLAYRDDPDTLRWLAGLGPEVQRCAGVLEEELRRVRLREGL